MATSYTTLLGLAQPATGDLSGTWGQVVNDNITAYLDDAIAGAQIISGTLTAVTLSKTTGANLSQAGTGSTGSSQYQIIRCTGAPASLLTITVPAANKTYVVINATSTSQSVKIVGAGPTTGVTIASGKTSIVTWNGSDFVEISPSTATNLASGSAGTIPYQSASGTTAMLAAGTTGQVLTSNGAAAPTWSTPAAATKTISNQVGAYTVVAGDLGKIINCTSGTFTVGLTAAASLGAGFTCTIWNTGTGAITIDPNAAETIDGVATLILRQGEGLAVVCNGTNWETDDKKPMRGYAENFYNGIVRPIASGSGSIAFGETASASGTYTIALGLSTTASATGAIAIGSGYASAVSAGSNYSTAFGTNSGANGSVTATGSGAMALGGSYASGIDSFAAAITNNTSSYGATRNNSIAIGLLAKATGIDSLAVGRQSQATQDGCSGLGVGASATGYSSSALGSYGTASGSYSLVIQQGTASANNSAAIGSNSGNTYSQAVTGAGAMALGGSYASGVDSFAAAIANNTSSYGATGANSVAMGNTCKSSGQYGVSLGYFNISSGSASFTVGLGNTASGAYSAAFGRYSTAAQSGKYAFGSAQNDLWAQGGKIVLSAATTTTTAVALTSDGGAASTTNQLIVASGQAMAIQGTLIAKVSGTGAMAGWNITGIVSNNGGTMAVSGLALTAIGTDSIGLGASPTIAVDNTNKGVTITSGYKSATNIRWVATLNTSEVTY